MTIEIFLVTAVALFAVGVYGVLSQQTLVMIMMGFELMLNAVILAGAAFWYFAMGGDPSGQTFVIVVLALMTVEMAMGFAVIMTLFRASDVDMTDMAGELKG